MLTVLCLSHSQVVHLAGASCVDLQELALDKSGSGSVEMMCDEVKTLLSDSSVGYNRMYLLSL